MNKKKRKELDHTMTTNVFKLQRSMYIQVQNDFDYLDPLLKAGGVDPDDERGFPSPS